MSLRPPMKKITFGANKEVGSTTLQKEQRKQLNLPSQTQNSVTRKPVFNLGKKKIQIAETKIEAKEEFPEIALQKKDQPVIQTNNKIMMRPTLKKKDLGQATKSPLQEPDDKTGIQTNRSNENMKTPFLLRNSINEKQKIIFNEPPADFQNIPQKPKMFDTDRDQKQFLRPPNLRPAKKIQQKIQVVDQNPQEDKLVTSLANDYQMSKEFQINNAFSQNNNQYKIDLKDLEQRQINFQNDTKHISEGKIQKQRQRANNLKRLLNLEIDTYQQTLNLVSITEYELYINKIKSGFINNSLDQAFDDKVDASCETYPLSFQNFTQQCPDDRNKIFIDDKKKNYFQSNSISFYNFLSKAATVMQQLLRPTKVFVMPPIYLLSLNPSLIWLQYCPYPTFLYKTEKFSIIAIGEKLYVARGDVTTVLGIGKFLLGGTKEGGIFLWAGKSEKGSLYDSVSALLNNSDFQLPSFSTQSIQKQSYFKNFSQVVKFVQKSANQFYSLEQFGKIILWRIVTEQNKFGQIKYILKPLSYISLTTLYGDFNLLCFDMEKDQDSKLYISSTKGIVRADASKGSPQLYSNEVRCRHISITKKNLIYCLNSDNSVSIYDKNISTCLLRFEVNCKGQLKDILIPRIEIQGRQLEISYEFYVIDSKGYAYRYNLLQNKSEPREILNNSDSEDKKFLYCCVSIQENQLQFLYVNRELKTKVITQNCTINLQKNPKNLKRIMSENKQFWQQLEQGICI